MARFFRFAILAVALLFARASFATTYYIAANGSDSNNGTSKTTPWLHAPGMTGCAANCAATAPQPGDQFIFRGGDTWHGGKSPLSLNWTWIWSGSNGNPIYIGVDMTWFSGSSWARPVLNGDNPLSTSTVNSCPFQVGGSNNFVFLNGVNYVIFDNFEFTGLCWNRNSPYGADTYIVLTGTFNIISNLYIHGWTHVAFNCTCNSSGGGACDGAIAYTSSTPATDGQGTQFVSNIIDGADSDKTSFGGFYGDVYDMHNNIIRNNSQAVVGTGMHTFHDNLIEWIYESSDSCKHSNVAEFVNEYPGTNYMYNNLFRHERTGVTVWPCPNSVDYYFNNVMYDTLQEPWNLDTANCGGAGGMGVFDNNIFADTGGPIGSTIRASQMTLNNTLFINSGHTTPITGSENNTITLSDAQATAMGLLAASDYQPTSGNCNGNTPCPIGAGANLTSSCSGTPGSALCSDTTLGGTRTAIKRPSSGAWDVGAYEFSGTTATKPAPPSGLTVTVH